VMGNGTAFAAGSLATILPLELEDFQFPWSAGTIWRNGLVPILCQYRLRLGLQWYLIILDHLTFVPH